LIVEGEELLNHRDIVDMEVVGDDIGSCDESGDETEPKRDAHESDIGEGSAGRYAASGVRGGGAVAILRGAWAPLLNRPTIEIEGCGLHMPTVF
jgi:hypothetical protein